MARTSRATTDRDLVVVGAGIMGRGIAYLGIAAGWPTELVDVEREQLERAIPHIEQTLRDGVDRGKLSTEEAERARKLLRTGTSLGEACKNAFLVIEAVPEDLALKHEVFRAIEEHSPDDAVLASNTSSLSISEIASVLGERSRFLGMHFFNPVPKMRLCELIYTLSTSPEALRTAEAAARTMGKHPVITRDSPGFLTTRFNALLGNESFRMLEEGLAEPEGIDEAVRLGLNYPMGPFEMVDLVGLDTRLQVLDYLSRRLGPRFRPTNLHRQLVALGRLGVKSGWGVYRYKPNGERVDDPSDLGKER